MTLNITNKIKMMQLKKIIIYTKVRKQKKALLIKFVLHLCGGLKSC